jgi:hypothetical protein
MIASKGPSAIFPEIAATEPASEAQEMEMIPDLERSSQRYIS